MAWLYGGDWGESRYPCDCAEMARQLMYAMGERIELVENIFRYSWALPLIQGGIRVIPHKPAAEDIHYIPANYIVMNFWFGYLQTLLGAITATKYKATSLWRPHDQLWDIYDPTNHYDYRFIGDNPVSLDWSAYLTDGPYASHYPYYEHQPSIADYFTIEDDALATKDYISTDPAPFAKMKDWVEAHRYLHTIKTDEASSTTVTDLSGTFTYG